MEFSLESIDSDKIIKSLHIFNSDINDVLVKQALAIVRIKNNLPDCECQSFMEELRWGGGGETDIQPERSLAICNKVYKPFSMKQSKT